MAGEMSLMMMGGGVADRGEFSRGVVLLGVVAEFRERSSQVEVGGSFGF